MNQVHYKSRSNDKMTNAFKSKALKTEKKNYNVRKPNYLNTEVVSRPGSPSGNTSPWLPSRNWHKYFSGNQPAVRHDAPSSSTQPVSPAPQAHWPEYPLGRPAELPLTRPPDELVTIKLPTVNFCSQDEIPQEELFTKAAPSISDLCEEDKRKIARLVEEVAKFKQEKQDDEDKISLLKSKLTELKTSLRNTMAVVKQSEEKTYSVAKSLQSNEQAVLKKQLGELNQLLLQMQVQKATTDEQVKTITVQAEKLTRALIALNRENTDLKVELRVTKDRLCVAQLAVDKMAKDLKEVQQNIKTPTEDKACQSNDNITSERCCVKTIDVGDGVPDDQHILTELFFNKSLPTNNFTPKETIIFLPSGDYNTQF